jgi:predicted nucleic acid-binding protein
MIVVSDTSCISNLLTIGHADLLRRLFGEVLIPPAVKRELLRFHAALPAFLQVAIPQDQARLTRLSRDLDQGESEAICLACEVKAERLLIDEKAGRLAALREGLSIIGLIGVLIAAKNNGHLASVAEVISRLEAEAGFRLGPEVKLAALQAAGESSAP